MKTGTSLLILLIGIIILSLGAWMYFSRDGLLQMVDFIQYAILIVLVATALLIGTGILGMAIIFALCWSYYRSYA
jgi:hypothetical protein